MAANRIKYTWVDEDGTEHYEILEIDECEITQIEAYYDETN